MNRDYWIYGVGAYLLLFMFAAVGTLRWRALRSGSRQPTDFKLLRGPGETLRRRVVDADENFGLHMALAGLFPFVITDLALILFRGWRPQTRTEFWVWAGVLILTFTISLFFAFRWAKRRLMRRRDDQLGYLGEREVAEHLQPLLNSGYRIFHDVPAKGNTKDFNLDHVVVGSRGVAIVETKTRRKGKKRSDGSDYRVTSDGSSLRWPWGKETGVFSQVRNQAEWLRVFIQERTGIACPIRSIVALPGWWVEETARHDVAVINSKNVVWTIEAFPKFALSPEQIDLIARQLDVLCRDVTD